MTPKPKRENYIIIQYTNIHCNRMTHIQLYKAIAEIGSRNRYLDYYFLKLKRLTQFMNQQL